jgi:hypothetical protein
MNVLKEQTLANPEYVEMAWILGGVRLRKRRCRVLKERLLILREEHFLDRLEEWSACFGRDWRAQNQRKRPPAVPPMPPAMALAETFSRGVTFSLPQAWRVNPLDAGIDGQW